ncbi:MAG TPA: CvpA family protein [Stellaceae bacterium]|nr:CvpA family protein [Stellaceae bacterium]
MNALDIVVIAVILLSGLFAFARGFVKEVLSVGAWIGAGLAALYALPYATPVAARFVPPGAVAEGAAGLAIFLVALIALSILTSAISRRVKDSALSAVDRTLGLIFGLVRGVVLVCLAYIALSWVWPADKPQPQPQWIAGARTLPLLANGAERLRQLLPAQYREKAQATASETRRAAEQLKEAAGAMGALTRPRAPVPPGRDRAPVYTPDDQRGLNRLIQQQQEDDQ